MHIKKLERKTVYRGGFKPNSLCPQGYAVHYKGFVSSGPDLGACIGRCYAAANQETV